MLTLLRASLAGRGNPFFRRNNVLTKQRADFTDKELGQGVEKKVDPKTGKWSGLVRLIYLYCNFYV